jgi:hypothetical protein|uniref:DUF2768 domain-containing protein n=1 Tax=viral metagenome TaxID=1070528 RepID=A0A6C0CTM9_9ZZZZ
MLKYMLHAIFMTLLLGASLFVLIKWYKTTDSGLFKFVAVILMIGVAGVLLMLFITPDKSIF